MKTDETWLDGPEFAGLASIDRTVGSRLLKAAHEEGKRWRGTTLKVRKVPGRGRGGFKYQVAARSLPKNLFQEYSRRKAAAALSQGAIESNADGDVVTESTVSQSHASAVPAVQDPGAKQKEKSLAQFNQLSPYKQRRAWAVFDVLQACDKYIQANNLARCRGEEVFANEFSRGRIDVSDRAREFVKGLKVRTLRNWFAAEHEHGLYGLADNRGARKGKSKLDAYPKIQEDIIGQLLDKTILRPGLVYDYVRAKYPDLAKNFSCKTIERFMKSWLKENEQLHLNVTHPDRWKNECKVAVGSQSECITALNQLWSLDDTRADILLNDGRYSMIFLIDIYSRRAMTYVIKNANAVAVGTLIWRAIHEYGAPQAILIDNGKPYRNAHIEGAMRSLDIETDICIPYASEMKAHIERVQRTFLHNLLEALPGFIGHNVTDRKRIEGKCSFAQRSGDPHKTFKVAMSAAELQDFANRWCEDRYQHKPHSKLPINPDTQKNFTPFQMAVAWREPVRHIEERALDILLLMKGEERAVGKKGIQLESSRYWDHALIPYIGQRVIVRPDPSDLGKAIVYSADKHHFICIAECPERNGISLKELAAEATAFQKQFLRQEKERFKAARAVAKKENVADIILRRDREAVANLAAFPHRRIAHITPGTETAVEAAKALQEAKAEKKKIVHQPIKAFESDVPIISSTVLRLRICQILKRGLTADEALRLNRKYSQGVREDQVETIARQLDAMQLVAEPDQPMSAEASAKE